MNGYPQVLSTNTLKSDKVVNVKKEPLGDVKEIMIDLDEGRIAYVVISFGGFLGMGDKLFAVPWEALTLDTDDHVFILNVDKERLEHAPGFDKDNWPDSAQYEAGWLLDVYDYYGYLPYWSGERQHKL